MKMRYFTLLMLSFVLLAACKNNNKHLEKTNEVSNVNNYTFSQQIIAARKWKDQYIQQENILEADKVKDFKGLNYFTPDSQYVVNTTIKFLKQEEKIFKTSKNDEPIYYTFCELTFQLNNSQHTLTAYTQEKENVTNLFIPFKDSTNNISTYGGGRYLELKYRNEKSNFIIDFNYAFNPYCHYNHTYSCPFVPTENWLKTNILAGEKKLYN